MAWPRYHYAEHTMLEVFTQQRQIPPLNFKLQLYNLTAVFHSPSRLPPLLFLHGISKAHDYFYMTSETPLLSGGNQSFGCWKATTARELPV